MPVMRKVTDLNRITTDPVMLGAIRKGKNYNHIWQSCQVCGKRRWVRIRRGKPVSFRCCACANKERGLERRGSNSEHWKGGIHIDNGYRKIYMPDHRKADGHGYTYEHILVWEEIHNQSLPEGWLVHHLNGIKDDNRPRNLLGMPKRKHSPALTVKEVQGKLREVEIENRQLRRALETNQMIWFGEN